MLNLRDGLVTPSPYLNQATPSRTPSLDAAGSSEFRRGWVTAGLGSDASELASRALEARELGDTQAEAAYMQQARDMQARAQQWAPTVQNFTDINGLGSALDWAGGALGNLRTSVPPALGSLAGAAVGGAVGLGLRNPRLGAQVGSYVGGFVPGYQMERNEAALGAMSDPEVLARNTPEEINRAVSLKGGINGLLESIVPAGITSGLIGGVGKKIAKDQLLKAAGREIAKDAGTEFATEGSQSLVGQGTENYLRGDPLTDFDYKQAFNEGMAGAVAGGGMGAVGAGGQILQNKLGGVGDKVAEVKRDPLGVVLDAGVDLAGKAGTAAAKVEDYLDRKLSGKTQEEYDREILDTVMGAYTPSAAAPAGTSELHLSDKELIEARKEQARKEGWDGKGDWLDFSRKNAEQQMQQAEIDKGDAMLAALEGRKPGEKKSLMRPVLTDDFGEQEGRDMSADTMSDNYGNAIRSHASDTVLPREHGGAAAQMRQQAQGEKVSGVEDVKRAKAAKVAEILVNQGYDEKIIKAAGNAHTRTQDVRSVADLIGWMSEKSGLTAGDLTTRIAPAIAERFGDKASTLVTKAYAAGVHEGLVPRNDEQLAKLADAIERKTQSDKQLGDIIVANLRPTVRAELDSRGKPGDMSYNKALSRIIGEVRRVANEGAAGGKVLDTQSLFKQRGVTDDEVMTALFGTNAEQVGTVMEAFYTPKSETAWGNDQKGDDTIESDGTPPAVDAAKSSSKDVFRKDGGFFDLHDVGQRAEFDAVGKKNTSNEEYNETDHTRREAKPVGIIDHALEQAEQERGALSEASKRKIIREMVHKLDPSIERMAPRKKHLSPVAAKDYDQRKAKYDKEINRAAMRLNKRYVALRVVSTEGDKMAREFTAQDLKDIELDRPLDHQNNTVVKGVIVFQKEGVKKPFITSVPLLMTKAYKFQNSEGYKNLEEGGSAYDLHTLMLDGVTSLAQHEGFTGKVGYINNGKVVWLNDKNPGGKSVNIEADDFPDNLLVKNGNKEKNQAPRFYGEVKASSAARREIGPVKSGEEWLENLREAGNDGRQDGLQERYVTSTKGKIVALSNMPNTTDEITSLAISFWSLLKAEVAKTPAGERLIKQYQAKFKEMVDAKLPPDELLAASAKLERLINAKLTDLPTGKAKYDAFVKRIDELFDKHFPDGYSYQEMVQAHWKPEGQVGNDTLADETPKNFANRDLHGLPDMEDSTMVAASFTGTSRKLDPAKADKGPVPSKKVERLVEPVTAAQRDSLVALTEMQDRVVELIRNTTQTLLDTIPTMSKFEVEKLKIAYFGKTTNGRTHQGGLVNLSAEQLGKLYPGTGRPLASRLAHAAERVHAAISKALEVGGNEQSARDSAGASGAARVGTSAETAGAGNNSAGGETGVASKLGRARATEESGVGASDAERSSDQGVTSENRLVAKLRTELEEAKTFRDKFNALFDELIDLLGDLDEFPGIFGHSFTYDKTKQAPLELAQYLDYLSRTVMRIGQKQLGTSKQREALSNMITKAYRAFTVWNGGKHVTDTLEAPVAVNVENGAKTNKDLGTKKSNQNAVKAGKDKAQSDKVKAAADHILKTVGSKIEVVFADAFTDGSSGSWTPHTGKNIIRIALNGDVMSTAFHESFHEFMDILAKNGGEKVVEAIRRAATSPIMLRKLDRLLEGHPEAQEQVRKDPDEAAAFMYQFWQAGALKVGTETRSAFQRIKDFFKKIVGLVSKELEKANADEDFVRDVMLAFSDGHVADATKRQVVVEALNKSAEAHDLAQQRVGKEMNKLYNTAAKLVFSAEAMIEATGNTYMGKMSEGFHQKAGTAMKQQSFSDAVRMLTNQYMHKLENILTKYDKEDLDLAREGMSLNKRPTSQEAGKAFDELKGFFAEMAKYLEERGVKRLDERNGSHVWVPIDFRKHYWPQVWDLEVLEKNIDQFRTDLLAHHAKELAAIAKEANAEVARRKGAGKNTASTKQLEAVEEGKQAENITPEMVADQIIIRLQHVNGQMDINEDLNDMGITPAASAVNRRVLDWLDGPTFEKYKSKDIARIMTSYTANMVRRAEYQYRFGPGGEVLRENGYMAMLLEIGGKELVNQASDALEPAIKAWRQAKAMAIEAGEQFNEPYPTLIDVGMDIHRAAVGREKASENHKKAAEKLEEGFKAIQAMEGTLGRDISPNFRKFSSWAVTYQNVTKLSTMLFTSFQDVMGLVANGGEMNDAWEAFVSGIKEIKNSWTNTKDTSLMMKRAEMYGTPDPISLQESLGQMYGSAFMNSSARRISDKFFKYTGAEGWNRGIRAKATQVAERIILEWKEKGVEKNDPAAMARVERLFGKNFDVSTIALDADGRLDASDPRNQAAVNRWVLDAVPTTNAAHRPIWGSDPHFQMFIQFKNYTYSFHRILLKGAVEQAKLGNYRPAMVLAVGYMPIAIAGGAIKEMLIPGDEPPWMKGGLDGYLEYGFSRAGVLGVPQMYAQNLYDLDPATNFGPTIDQIQNILSVPLLDNRTAMGEILGALPGGNILRRAA